MKFKLLQFLTVCLVTLLVLSPELVVFSIIWEQHLELKQTMIVIEANQNYTNKATLASIQEGKKLSQDNLNLDFATKSVFKESLAKSYEHQIANILHWFFLLFPILLGVLIFLYDRYLIYRASVFQQQVEMLERLWQQSIEQ